jgi:hypothetical protein
MRINLKFSALGLQQVQPSATQPTIYAANTPETTPIKTGSGKVPSTQNQSLGPGWMAMPGLRFRRNAASPSS